VRSVAQSPTCVMTGRTNAHVSTRVPSMATGRYRGAATIGQALTTFAPFGRGVGLTGG
jgi:hypothetical protein